MGCHIGHCNERRPCCCCRKEFPEADFYDLPSQYLLPEAGQFSVPTIQLRKILGGIMREKRVTSQLIESMIGQDHFRQPSYGVRSKHVHTVFISHQMMIKIPGRNSSNGSSGVAEFSSIAVSIASGCRTWQCQPNLSGDLFHLHPVLPTPTFIGLLNRFSGRPTLPCHPMTLCILSGLEPQRSIFEKMILEQATAMRRKFIIVQGSFRRVRSVGL